MNVRSKKQFLSAIINNTLIISLPLIIKPSLIIHYKILTFDLIAFIMWLTQPVFSFKEAKEQKENDHFSVFFILIMSAVSTIIPIIDWAYFQIDYNHFGVIEYFSLFLIITGILIRVWAVNKLGIFFTPTVQIQTNHKLVTKGPYSLVRHPSYLGAFLCITSASLFLNSIFGYVIACLCMGTAYYYRIKIEELKLIEYFGSAYKSYKHKTKKFIPFIL